MVSNYHGGDNKTRRPHKVGQLAPLDTQALTTAVSFVSFVAVVGSRKVKNTAVHCARNL